MLPQLTSLARARPRLLNLSLLVAGYGSGQGAIFLAQSWLVTTGNLDLLALFGTHFAFAMLGLIVVEAGSLTILAKFTASNQHGTEGVSGVWRSFWEMSFARLLLAIAVISAGAAFAEFASTNPFTRTFVLCVAPAFVLFALSPAGILDGLRLSGISGISGSLAHAASAVALLYVRDAGPAEAGALLGGAFAMGSLATIVVQFVALHVVGWSPRFVLPRVQGVRKAATDGLTLLGSTLPGQLYFRGQLLMSATWLGPGPTALFVYVKQIVTALAQLIGFIRRVEFPNLVNHISNNPNSSLSDVLSTQRQGTIISIILTILLIIASAVLINLGSLILRDIGIYMALFSAFIVTGSVILGMVQALAALGLYKAMFLRTAIVTAIGLFVSYIFTAPFGILGFAIADAVCALTSLVVLRHFFINRLRAPGVTP